MKRIVLLLVLMLAGAPLAVSGVDRRSRSATLIDNTGTEWEITDVFVYSEPGGFYESRFCFAVTTDTFHVAIPPENLISVDVDEGNCIATYQWMGKTHTIIGKIASKLVGGKSNIGNVTRDFDNVKKLTFKQPPPGIKWEQPFLYESTLVLADGTKVPVAKLLRVSSQPYPASPSSGIDAGTVFDLYNDIGFLRGESAPTIRFEDVRSIEFPTENSITFTLKQGVNNARSEAENDADNKAESDNDNKGKAGDSFLTQALDDLLKDKGDKGKPLPKNWAYGLTGIYSKGFFFIPCRHVKAVEFGNEEK